MKTECLLYRQQCLFLRTPLGPLWFKKKKSRVEEGKSERIKDGGEEHERNTSDISHWFCLYRRDGSASATYYFKNQSAVEIGSKSWLYLRTLKRGEEEFPLRNEQVRWGREEVACWPKDVGKMMTFVYLIISHRADCAPRSPYFPFPKDMSEGSLSNQIPLMKYLGHSKNKDQHENPRRWLNIQNSFVLELKSTFYWGDAMLRYAKSL